MLRFIGEDTILERDLCFRRSIDLGVLSIFDLQMSKMDVNMSLMDVAPSEN